ncbi:MAG: serine/threonine protein kinase [Deltaproteobacteria bacterium]|nr:serine/threonine protein kinase [Deltaproteobacteria bacterium]MDQ3294976.1 serine/threonine protein kinase [Myxococcota bacterium]
MGVPAALQITRMDIPGATLLTLVGTIDADFDRKVLAASGVVMLDLSGVTRITSYGVREWMRMLSHSAATYLGFIGCRPPLVAQFNMVAGFACQGEILSLYLPYLCESCGTATERLMDLRTKWEMAAKGTVPEAICESCGAQAEFDDVPESYFSHVASNARPSPPALAERLLSGESSAGADKFRVRKEVHGQVTSLWLSGALDTKVRIHRLVDGLEGTVVVIGAGITTATSDLQRLLALADVSTIQLYFARLPPFLIRALPEADRQRLTGRIISAYIPFHCFACHFSHSVEIDASRLGNPPNVCSRCGSAHAGVVDPELAEILTPLLATCVPREVLAYLEARPGIAPRDEDEATSPGIPSLLAFGTPTAHPDRIAGKYQILARIGIGGMAEVFLAKQHGLRGFEKRVALKRILPMLASSDNFIDMFLREARLAAQISHPNVVQIFDLCTDDGNHFIAMEYVAGWDLRAVLKATQVLALRIPVAFACRVAADVCAGLHAAHSLTNDTGGACGLVHRDISPPNLLLSMQGAVKVSDFGIAKAVGAAGGAGVGTRPGVLKGKLAYMAPEQIDPEHGPIGYHTDIYAVGLVLYEMLSGIAPFRRDDEVAAMRAAHEAIVPAMARTDLPPTLTAILARALSRSIADRYAAAIDMQHDLEHVLMELGTPTTQRDMTAWLADLAAAAVEHGEWLPADKTPTGVPARATRGESGVNPQAG